LKLRLKHLSIILLAALLALSAYSGLAAGDDAVTSSEIAGRIEQQREDVEKAREEIADIDRELLLLQSTLDQRRTDLANASTLLAEAEDRYQASITVFNDRVASIYKLGTSKYYEILVTADTFTDSISRLSLLGIISENDMGLMERVRAEQEEVRALHARVDSLKQAQMHSIADLQKHRVELETTVASGQAQIDTQSSELEKTRQKEREMAAAESQTDPQNDSFSLYSGLMGPSLPAPAPTAGDAEGTGVVLDGIASWYGPGFNGHTTANGEIYNMYDFTAAHKTLPFNTRLKVTYNGRSVLVRINDRGPYVGERFLDLSAASAQAIGLSGIGYVTAEIYR
jgi:rare lipoprotein A (peptidoglycan hydrolase)